MGVDSDVKKLAGSTKKLLDVTETLAQQDVSFHKTVDPAFAKVMAENSNSILDMINDVILSLDGSVEKIKPGKDGLDSSWKYISNNVLDNLFEKSEIASDRMRNGNKMDKRDIKPIQTINEIDNEKPRGRQAKPQLKFLQPVDNSESLCFQPKLHSKPNAVKTFDQSMELVVDENETHQHHQQPYEYEIMNCEYPTRVLELRVPVDSKPWPGKEPTWVDTIEKFNQMVKELEPCTEIAVDLEHHDYRTYYGLVCLMQISNRENDWLIDTLALRDDLEPLNKIFTNKDILKVFHGAHLDIIWLQRDLGLYVVSLFDTYHATKALGFPKHSLAFLLEKYANFKTNKKYQMADWRIRPLTAAMSMYARSDTHFLLNIYDQLRNSLVEKNILNVVLHESRKVARRRFEYYSFRPTKPSLAVATPITDRIEPWRAIINQYNISLTKKHLVVDLYDWRDRIARRDDESVRYVMSNQLLVALVLAAPTDSFGVIACSDNISEHVRLNAKEIADIIKLSLRASEDEDMELLNQATYLEIDDDDLSERNVNANISGFNQVISNFSLGTSGSLLKRKSNFLSGNMFLNLNNYVWARDYSKNESYSVKDLQLREAKVADKLRQDIGKIIKIVEPKQELSVKVVSIPVVKEDPNEIIVLKKKNPKQIHNRKPEVEVGSVFDYKSANKILTGGTRYERKRKTFDGAKDFEGPKAVKKVTGSTRGKQLSYKTH